MISLTHARKARNYFPLTTRKSRAVQAARYAAAIEFLGDRWLLARKCERLDSPRPV